MENLEASIASRKVYVMFEDELGCDPATDHLSPKSLLPIYRPALAVARGRLQQLLGPLARMQLRTDLTGLLREASFRASSLGTLLSEALSEKGVVEEQLRMLEDRVTRYVAEASEDKAALTQYILTLKEQFQQRKRMASDNLGYKPDFIDVDTTAAPVRQLVLPTARRREDSELLGQARRNVTALQAELQNRDAAIRSLQEQLEASKAASSQAAEAQTQALQLQHQLEASLKGEDELKARLAELEEERALLLVRVVDAKSAAEAQKREASHARRELAALMALSDKRQQEAGDLVSAAEAKAENYQRRIEELEAALQDSRGEVSSLRTASLGLEARLASLLAEKDPSGPAAENDALKAEISSLRKQLDSQARQLRDSESESRQLRAAADRLRRLVTAKDAQILSMRNGGVGLLPHTPSSGDDGENGEAETMTSSHSSRSSTDEKDQQDQRDTLPSPLPQLAEAAADQAQAEPPASIFQQDLDQIVRHAGDLARIEEAVSEVQRAALDFADFGCQVSEEGSSTASEDRAFALSISEAPGLSRDELGPPGPPLKEDSPRPVTAIQSFSPSRAPELSGEPESQAIIMSESPVPRVSHAPLANTPGTSVLGKQHVGSLGPPGSLEVREVREAREVREVQGSRESRDTRDARDTRETREAAELRARAAMERVISRHVYGTPKPLAVEHEVIDFDSMPEVFKRLSSEADVLRLKLQSLKEKWLGIERQKLGRLLRHGPRIIRGPAALSVMSEESNPGGIFVADAGAHRIYEKGVLRRRESSAGPAQLTQVHASQGYISLINTMGSLLQRSLPRSAGSGLEAAQAKIRERPGQWDGDQQFVWSYRGNHGESYSDGERHRDPGESGVSKGIDPERGHTMAAGGGAEATGVSLDEGIPEWLSQLLGDIYAANFRSTQEESVSLTEASDNQLHDHSALRLDYSEGAVSSQPLTSSLGVTPANPARRGELWLSGRISQMHPQYRVPSLSVTSVEAREQALSADSKTSENPAVNGPTHKANDLLLSQTVDEMAGMGAAPPNSMVGQSSVSVPPKQGANDILQRVAETLGVQHEVSRLSTPAGASRTPHVSTSRPHSTSASGEVGGQGRAHDLVGLRVNDHLISLPRNVLGEISASPKEVEAQNRLRQSQGAAGPGLTSIDAQTIYRALNDPHGLSKEDYAKIQTRLWSTLNWGDQEELPVPTRDPLQKAQDLPTESFVKAPQKPVAAPTNLATGKSSKPTSAMVRAMEARSLPRDSSTAAVSIVNASASMKKKGMRHGSQGSHGGITGGMVHSKPKQRDNTSTPRSAHAAAGDLALSGSGHG